VAPASNEDSDTVEFTEDTTFGAREAIVDPNVKILQVGRAAAVAPIGTGNGPDERETGTGAR
jgi:hypothetical protein